MGEGATVENEGKEGDRVAPPATEGARLLRAVRDGVRGVAGRLGVAPSQVTRWRNGVHLPGPEQRDALAREYGIPGWAWDRAPKSADAPPPASSTSPPASGEPSPESASATVSGEMTRLAREQLRRVIEDANAEGSKAPSVEMRAKLSAHAVRIMELIAKMERDAEDLEGRAVRRSRFLARVVDRIVVALRPFPDASEAVERELEALDLARPTQGALDEIDR